MLKSCRRRCEIAETLVEKNFDLAFQVIYEFTLPGRQSQPLRHYHKIGFYLWHPVNSNRILFPAVDIYAGVAASLAERKKGGQLTEFFRNIKGTIEDDEWDQVFSNFWLQLYILLVPYRPLVNYNGCESRVLFFLFAFIFWKDTFLVKVTGMKMGYSSF